MRRIGAAAAAARRRMRPGPAPGRPSGDALAGAGPNPLPARLAEQLAAALYDSMFAFAGDPGAISWDTASPETRAAWTDAVRRAWAVAGVAIVA